MFRVFKSMASRGTAGSSEEFKKVSGVADWYSARYVRVVLQRNVLLLLNIILAISVVVSVYSVVIVSNSRTLEPFVVEIQKKSGIVSLVDPVTVKKYSADELVNDYFVVEYIRAREVYDPYSYLENYYVKVRLLSTQDVYNQFRSYLRLTNPSSPFNLYADGKIKSSALKVRSIQRVSDKVYQVRFTIELVNKIGQKLNKDKIATVEFGYFSINMSKKDREVNPLGFQVIAYRSDDEYL